MLRPEDRDDMTQGFFLLVFVVILGILGFQLLLSAARRQGIAGPRRNGTRVAAVVSNLVHERIQTDDPTNPATSTDAGRWYIECQWTDPRSSSVYTFRSDAVDEATAQSHPAGSPIRVLIAPGDPDNYYVELTQS